MKKKTESKPSQLSFEFSAMPQSAKFEVNSTPSVVTYFISRDAVATRRMAIERVQREGIFRAPEKEKV